MKSGQKRAASPGGDGLTARLEGAVRPGLRRVRATIGVRPKLVNDDRPDGVLSSAL